MSTKGFRKGFSDGIPIGLGYLMVSFTFGMMVVSDGLPLWSAALISMTNLTSAGQFAGLSLIVSGGSLIEVALTQLIINMRYFLMSLALSQRLDSSVTAADRFLISFGNTDEVFAVASGNRGEVGRKYMYGLILFPYIGWAMGTVLGACIAGFLPPFILSAAEIAVYGMFLAIIVPPSKGSRPVALTVVFAAMLSCLFYYVPVLNKLSGGFVIIICTVVTAALAAVLFPIRESAEVQQ